MRYDRAQLLERLLTGYSGSYDIDRAETGALPALQARAHFHVEEAQYVISRRATMWETESDEYVWFFSLPRLTAEDCERCIRFAHEEGMSKIDLSGERHHMVTRLVAVFLTDEAEPEALAHVQKCRLYKSFQFSLRGWMEFHAVAADLGKESVVSNPCGRETAKFLKTLMCPETGRKGKKRLGLLRRMLQ